MFHTTKISNETKQNNTANAKKQKSLEVDGPLLVLEAPIYTNILKVYILSILRQHRKGKIVN